MKKRIFTAICVMVMCVSSVMAQGKMEKCDFDNTNASVTLIMSCPQTKDVLYRAAKEWLSSNIKDFQKALQYEDKETGTIKFSCSSFVKTSKAFNSARIEMEGNVNYIVAVTCKDNKIRVKSDNVMVTWNETMVMGMNRMNNGTKTLDAINFAKWCEDPKCLNNYTGYLADIATGITDKAKTQAADDDF